MAAPKFRQEVTYDESTGQPVAGYLRIREGAVASTKEISDGLVFADYDADGTLLGIELLGPCAFEILEHLAENEPEAIRRFLREGVRRSLVSR